jgi:hypothetical protein
MWDSNDLVQTAAPQRRDAPLHWSPDESWCFSISTRLGKPADTEQLESTSRAHVSALNGGESRTELQTCRYQIGGGREEKKWEYKCSLLWKLPEDLTSL